MPAIFTDEQLRKVFSIIRNYHAAVIVNTLGVRGPLTDAEFNALKALGMVDETLRKPLQDAFLFGRLQVILKNKRAKAMSFQEFSKFLKTYSAPITSAEKEAMRYAAQNAGASIRNLGYAVDRKTGETMLAAARRYTNLLAGQVRTSVVESIAKRQTVRELEVVLRRLTGDHVRDFLKIASTESHEAFQAGLAKVIEQEHTGDALVIKLPRPDACDRCKAVFLNRDGTPKVFKLKDLEGKSNVGLPKDKWGPVLGACHPWCGCQLIRVPKGWGWDKKRNRLAPDAPPLKKAVAPGAFTPQVMSAKIPGKLMRQLAPWKFKASLNDKGLWEYHWEGDRRCAPTKPKPDNSRRLLSALAIASHRIQTDSSRSSED